MAHADINSDLINAAKIGHTTNVKALLDKGAAVNAKDTNGATALIWAAYGGHAETVKLLLDKEANLNLKTNDGWTALMFAKHNGHKIIVELLESKGTGYTKIKSLTKKQKVITQQQNFIKKRCGECGQVFSSSGKDKRCPYCGEHWKNESKKNKSNYGQTNLPTETTYEQPSIAESLKIIIGNNKSTILIIITLALGLLSWLRLLLNNRKTPKEIKIYDAVIEGNIHKVKKLLDKGVKIDSHKDKKDRTALMEAAESGYKKIVKLLLNYDANVYAKDIWGNTALILAAQNGHDDTVQLLLDAGADANVKDKNGYNASMWAIKNNNITTAEMLPDYEENLSAYNSKIQQPTKTETKLKIPYYILEMILIGFLLGGPGVYLYKADYKILGGVFIAIITVYVYGKSNRGGLEFFIGQVSGMYAVYLSFSLLKAIFGKP